ncbi:hypothetical protein [Desulfoscipio gibsoniae]
MMQILQFVWNEDIIEHIVRHEEIEGVCFGKGLKLNGLVTRWIKEQLCSI